MTQTLDPRPAPPRTAFTVAEMAGILGVTPRRVRQMRTDGLLLARGRGKIDAAHGVKAMLGSRWLGPARRDVCTYTKAAAGWLISFQGTGLRPADMALWFDAAAGWGLDEPQAAAALFNAVRLLGEAGPAFHDTLNTKGGK